MIERREPRYEVELAAEVDTPGETLFAATTNLSRGGVCLDVEKALQEGTTLELSLFLTLEGIEHADEDALVVQARVAWCSERDDGGFLAGVQFGTLSAAQTAAVDTFLAQLTPQGDRGPAARST
jgi:hypothetical protein